MEWEVLRHRTVAACAEGRDNNFNLVRFLAATSVILFHCYALLGRRDAEPLVRLSGGGWTSAFSA